MEKTFRVFYSWQSDLPASKTRNFIRECIDRAIKIAKKSEMIEAVRDEATTGITGSPDIVSSIYSKIEQCDLFIADVSLCYLSDKEKTNNHKKSPNPNVLLELGYAAHVLNWERIICLFNTEFGEANDLPFDIQHNRVIKYFIDPSKSRNEILLEQASLIASDIVKLRDAIPRSQQGTTNHIIGSYNQLKECVERELHALKLTERLDKIKTDELKSEAQTLYHQICELTLEVAEKERIAKENERLHIEEYKKLQGLIPAISKLPDFQENLQSFGDSIKAGLHLYCKPIKANLSDDVTTWLEELLGVSPCDGFYNFGSLAENSLTIGYGNKSYLGTEQEIEKYQMYKKLVHKLFLLWVRTSYLKTFDGMVFFPIAIQNLSAIEDTNIRIIITVSQGTIVHPNEDLIEPHMAEYAKQIAKTGIIEELFSLPESRYIETEQVPLNVSDIKIPQYHVSELGITVDNHEDTEVYKKALEEYIMSPTGKNYYNFTIDSLRPNECKWLCRGVLIHPNESSVTLEYRIHSKRSRGEISGTLYYVKE